MNNFVVIESVHGKFIVNRHCFYQAEALIKTGATHIEAELKNMLAIVSTLPTGAVAVDAGANIGFVCVPLANALKKKAGRVYAFEVQEMLYNALCGTVALNDLENLQVRMQGLGDCEAALMVPRLDYSKPQDFGMLSLVADDDSAVSKSQSVQMTMLDHLGLTRLDFLKIDVEGMEMAVLAGGRQMITLHRPWCWIEYWKIPAAELKAYFEDLDYTLYKMDPLNVLCAPNEKKAELPHLMIDAPRFE